MKQRILKRSSYLRLRAKELNSFPPRSEVWFWDRWESLGMLCPKEYRNLPFLGCIPDVINTQSKYIIEVDGSIHDQLLVKARDRLRDERFSTRGYLVFRIKAYDEDGIRRLSSAIKEARVRKIDAAIKINSRGRFKRRKRKNAGSFYDWNYSGGTRCNKKAALVDLIIANTENT